MDPTQYPTLSLDVPLFRFAFWLLKERTEETELTKKSSKIPPFVQSVYKLICISPKSWKTLI